jgi:radical SAM protein with 4Fe4S-binding SPASM domain
MESLAKTGIEALPKPLLETRFSLLDECRWAPLPCPACNLSRIVIHKDRNITPCITGDSIGKVGEDISRIKERLELYKEKEEKKRGCATCPAQDTCSHCLFPAPLDRSEFCRRQQNTFNLQPATNIFSSLRAAYQLQSRKLFFTFYPNLSPKTLQGIDRLAKALQLRKTLKNLF